MSNDKVILGVREVYGQETAPVMLSCADRRHPVYVCGKSGTGKTTLLENLIQQDIESGQGVAFVDPHGDKAWEILDKIPRHRIDDVVYFDPSDSEYAVGFNLFARVPAQRRHLVASGIVAAFKGIFPDYFGPRMEYVFHAAVRALLDCEDVSLLGLQRMLSDARYRAWVVRQIEDPIVRYFWEHEFESHDKKTKAEMVSPILNKVGPMLMSPAIRNILGQVRSRIDTRFIMDNGKIFIANLAKGKLGEHEANLLGSFLVADFQLAAMSRADVPESERRDFFFYVDEFHSFVSEAFATILSEARKYRLCLTIAHQYLGQLKPSIAAAVIGNVGSTIAFRVGHEDAKGLEKAYGNSYAASAFTSLNNQEVYAKLLSDGKDLEPFLVQTRPPYRSPRKSRRETIILRSRAKYAIKIEVIERKIKQWIRNRRG